VLHKIKVNSWGTTNENESDVKFNYNAQHGKRRKKHTMKKYRGVEV
jgi:hypothetical protein